MPEAPILTQIRKDEARFLELSTSEQVNLVREFKTYIYIQSMYRLRAEGDNSEASRFFYCDRAAVSR